MTTLEIPTMLQVILALAAGVVIGYVYCRALWRDVRVLAQAPVGGRRIVLGALLRTCFVSACLVLVGSGNPVGTVLALAAFATTRAFLTRRATRVPG